MQDAAKWLDSKVIDADTFGELLDHLQAQWTQHDQAVKQRREEAARALLHAEQRNLLAQKLAGDFAEALNGLQVAEFVGDFLRGSWAQVVAEAQLSCTDGSDDPFGYRAVVDDLVWSVQKTPPARAHPPAGPDGARPAHQAARRPQAHRLSAGADGAVFRQPGHHPPVRAAGRARRRRQGRADAVEAQASEFGDSAIDAAEMWLADHEAAESGFLDHEAMVPEDLGVLETPEPDAPAPVAPGSCAPEPGSS